MRFRRLSLGFVLGFALLAGSQAWSATASPVVIKQGRIAMEAFTGGKKFLMEGRDNGMPFRIFLPPEAFTAGGFFHPSSYATLPEDATNSFSTRDYLYFYVNDEGTAPNFISETGATLTLVFSDFSLRDSVLHVTMEYKIQAPAAVGFPLNRVEVYPAPNEVNPRASAAPATASGTVSPAAIHAQLPNVTLTPSVPDNLLQGSNQGSEAQNSAGGAENSGSATQPEGPAAANSGDSAATVPAPTAQTGNSAVGRSAGCNLTDGTEPSTWSFLLLAHAGILWSLALRLS